MSNRCECDVPSEAHPPNKCTGKRVHHVRRGDRRMWLCDGCTLTGDVYEDPEWDEVERAVSDLLDWKYEVASDDTLLGFVEWCAARAAAAERDGRSSSAGADDD